MAVFMSSEPQFLDKDETETGAIVGQDAGAAL
jgi:hypothetical protein